ncbi:MAG: glycosyl transferase family 1 [Terriglobia bacterium]|nr:MAG: glycosyl transferase family 1 [Terriglobia bacterium]
MRLALLGTRGIPACYGGFETFAEELSTRLAARGHHVTVYSRTRFTENTYRGVRLQFLPTIRHKYFDTLAHTFLSTMYLLWHRPEVALYCNGANAIFTGLPRCARVPVALNVDGIERKRKKWNRLAKAWYLASEWLSTFCPNVVVTDARAIQDYYLEQYRKQSVFIPYGAPVGRVAGTAALEKLGLQPGRYFLYVSRMEPENHPLEVRQAFETVETDFKLVLVGDAPYARDYIRRVRDTRDSRVVIPGAIYGEEYHELGSHCFAYIHATEVGGTHPALIEAMGRGALVLYRNTPENAEVAAGVGLAFEPEELAGKLRGVLAMSGHDRDDLRQRAMDRVRAHYSWDAVTDAYEELLAKLAVSRGKRR